MHHPTDRIAHTTAFVTPVVEHWLEREIAQWVHHMKDRSDDPSHHERPLLPRSYMSLLLHRNERRIKEVCVHTYECMYIYLSICLSIYLFIYLFIYLLLLLLLLVLLLLLFLWGRCLDSFGSNAHVRAVCVCVCVCVCVWYFTTIQAHQKLITSTLDIY